MGATETTEATDPGALARRCQQTLPDDTRAFEQLVALYKGRVYATAYRLMGDRQDADDLAQEVFLKVYRTIATLDEPATLTAWIYRITTNTCLDALTGRRRRPRTTPFAPPEGDDGARGAADDPELPDHATPSPEEAALGMEVRRCIDETLTRLEPVERAVLVLREIEERSYQEIAESVAVGLSAVKMRIHRARVAFGRVLAEICPDTWRRYAAEADGDAEEQRLRRPTDHHAPRGTPPEERPS